MKNSTRIFAVLMLAVMLVASSYAFVSAANPPQPTYGSATVDGDPSEWDLTNDFFADMYRAGNPDKPVESKLYLRYDCETGTLYALVLGEPDVPVLVEGDDAFIKIPELGVPGDKLVDGAGGGVAGAEFEWINERTSDIPGFGGKIADGWEASAPLLEGAWTINVHTQVWDDGESQTSAVKDRGIPLVIECKPTAITLPSSTFTAEVSSGRVTLTWETGTEVNNAGFNLYRALLKDGPYTQINEAFITAQGDAVSGASYSFLDTLDYGTFYYTLEDMDLYGMSTLHGPVKVTVARPLRRPLYRPSLPEF